MSFGAVATLTRGLDRVRIDHERRPAGAGREDLLAQVRVIRSEAEQLQLTTLVGVAALREGELLLAAGDHRGAVAVLAESVPRLEDDLLAIALARMSEALIALGCLRAALEVCARGIELVERDRGKTSAAYLQAAYLRRTISLYANGVRAAHALGDSRMLAWMELSKGRVPRAGSPPPDMRERLAELGDRIDRARDTDAEAPLRARRRALYDRLLGAAREPAPVFDLAAVQAALAPGQRGVSYYWLDRTSLLVAVVGPDEVAAEVRTVDREPLEALAAMVLRSGAVEFQVPTTLLDSVLDALTILPDVDADRLLISPHRILHIVPFAALLLRRAAVATIPNLTCLQAAPDGPSRRVLAVGVNEYAGATDLPRAQEATAEVAALYAAHGYDAGSLLGADVTEAALNAELDTPPAVLHLTLHGESVASDTPLESSLLLGGTRLDGLDLVGWRLDGSTVVLAACSSGQRAIGGRGMAELPGDDVLGLQAAFFSAGARQLLSALWPVEFPVARSITGAFHAELLAGRPADVALRATLTGHLDNARVRHRATALWAPFTLTCAGPPQPIGGPA